jgi:2-methylcitrate dehydratase PrpD
MKVWGWIHQLEWAAIPSAVQYQARRCLLDTVGAGIGGRQTKLSTIVHDYATLVYGGRGAHLWLNGGELSPPGAALANGMTIDALDIHDGFKPSKGHAGAGVVPAALATVALNRQRRLVSGAELLTRMVIGYEVALRAAMSLHATACDYHTSGAWVALGCAALTARALGLDRERTRHALGIAEYHGPRSPMMRCIDHPTMLKDGAGWGAMTGVSAAMLADGSFTGAPALTVEGAEVAHFWADLGERWLILEQYFKPYAVCYWAQAPISAARQLQAHHQIPVEAIRRIEVSTFYNATRLSIREPKNTEEAQYSLPFPVAAALVHERVGATEVNGESLRHPQVLALAQRVELIEEPSLTARYPAERLCRVTIETTQGARHSSDLVEAPWGHQEAPTDEQLHAKFYALTSKVLPHARAVMLHEMLWGCAQLYSATSVLEVLAPAMY